MQVQIILPLWPFDERHQLEDGDLVGEKDMRRLLRYYRRAAAVLPRLLADGWEMWYTRCGLWGDHEDVATCEEARERLAVLGIPPGWVETFGGIPKSEPDDNDSGPAGPSTEA